MARYEIHIPNWHPMRLNQLLHGHWAKAAAKKKRDREMIYLYSLTCQVPKATLKRRVTLTITLGPRQRSGDVDAYWKSLLDGMKHAGLIRDDNYQWVELAPLRCQRGPEKATTILLEDVGEVPPLTCQRRARS